MVTIVDRIYLPLPSCPAVSIAGLLSALADISSLGDSGTDPVLACLLRE